jgi:lipoprotein-releasing system ATP-binding protein
MNDSLTSFQTILPEQEKVEPSSVLSLKGIEQSFGTDKNKLCVLKGVDFHLQKGQVVALTGPSGSGKTTLLQIAGLLERPTKGEVVLDGKNCEKLNDKARTLLRRDYVGFVYQNHLLLSDFTALENVMIPLKIALKSPKEQYQRAAFLLERMGLKDRMTHRPAQMSGGEIQRVAIARALANEPKVLLADEPTGNLDPETSLKVFDLLLQVVRETGLSALIATHNPELASQMDRCIRMKGGLLEEEERRF